MNIFRILADLSHLLSILILLQKMKTSSVWNGPDCRDAVPKTQLIISVYWLQSCSGISFKSQALYFFVYVTRYLDIFWSFTRSPWNTIFKIIFISSSAYILYLMLNDYKPTHDPNLDTFRASYLLGGSAVLAVMFPDEYTPAEILWAFSIWLESVAVLPQLFLLQRTGEAETITTHYLFALGIYRALYIPNWIYRYFTEGHFDKIAVLAGVVQTVLYSDFFWVYYTKVWKGKSFKLPV